MANENARIDENRAHSLLLVTDDSDQEIRRAVGDAATGRLKCTASLSGLLSGVITSLNTLTGSAQLLTTGTTGTDFDIVSSGTTHTFNLPTASGSVRGALSAANWTTFNNKQNALTFSTGLTNTADVITVNASQIDHSLLTNLNSASYTHLTSANATDLTDGGNTTLHVHDQYILADGTRAFTGNQSLGGYKITSLGTPTAGTDAANKDYVDAIASGFTIEASVLNYQTTPPVSPNSGDRYLVDSVATGDWTGQENDIAEYNGAAWDFTTPTSGYIVLNENDGITYLFDGSNWQELVPAQDHTALNNLNTANYYHLTQTQHGDLTDGGDTSLHIHDARYFTETEADSRFAAIANGVTNGDSHNHVGGDGAQIDHLNLANIGTNAHTTIDTHLASTSNPHSVTKTQVGLANVTNDAQVKKISSSTNNNIPQWDGVTGALLKDGLTAGTGASDLVQLNGSAQLPAVDGSLLTGVVSDTTTRMRAFRNAAQTIPASVITKVAINGESYDSGNNFDVTSNEFTAPVSGYYQVCASITFTSLTANGILWAIIQYDGSYSRVVQQVNSTPTTNLSIPISDIVYCASGGKINLAAYNQNTGSSSVGVVAGYTSTFMSIHLLSK